MTINWLSLVIGVVIGLLIMGALVWLMMPSMMLVRHKTGQGYGDVLAKLNEILSKKGDWKVVHTNDYQQTTANFAALEKVCSVNVCNLRYAARILDEDGNRGVTAFMPLSLGVYEDKHGKVYISQLNVGLLGMMFGGTIAKVMKMAGKDINEVVGSIIALK
ncbi:MAG: hypothetical protein C3F13_14360 [Anaerolineales bacterium]|nr:DUF302 domain-containing protein [Anaerolineae bacterium]PWB51613.1 MAG: hypothetical protein C3F13_14360 [Anaerolineales bacterium]